LASALAKWLLVAPIVEEDVYQKTGQTVQRVAASLIVSAYILVDPSLAAVGYGE
jgi:hypothetical protein